MTFSHSPDYPYTAGGTFQYTDANNIEDGVAANDTALNSITGNDAGSQPSTDGPFTLATFINNILKQLRNITGKTHWYTAPATSIEALNTSRAAYGAHNAVGTNLKVSAGTSLPVALDEDEIFFLLN